MTAKRLRKLMMSKGFGRNWSNGYIKSHCLYTHNETYDSFVFNFVRKKDMTNRQKYYSDEIYSSMTDEELARYINERAELRAECDDLDEPCSRLGACCEKCCLDWLSKSANDII